ncbi:MAG: preprotein translocase subunit SecE [Candidatus Gracilibacteria bacterium]|nr:preprotein translocase subunit SecE [Candidatus Gracilibacteria bacterium]MDD2908905.1 preprotein translocase subunit SecE [Candidatus Gracilibacteria bacterium]
MFKFLKESKKEFQHVVRPTNKETKKYFSIVSISIIVLTLFLYIVGTVFSGGLFALKDAINPPKIQQTNTSSNTPTDLKLGTGSVGTTDLSGSTSVTPTVATGAAK